MWDVFAVPQAGKFFISSVFQMNFFHSFEPRMTLHLARGQVMLRPRDRVKARETSCQVKVRQVQDHTAMAQLSPCSHHTSDGISSFYRLYKSVETAGSRKVTATVL